MNIRTRRSRTVRWWLLTLALLLIMTALIGSSLQPTAAATATRTRTRTAQATHTSTPDNLDQTLVVDLGDDFSPDLVADVSIGTIGIEAVVYCAINISNGVADIQFSQQDVFEVPDFRVNLPSICADAPINGAVAIAPNGGQVNAALFTQSRFDTGATIYVAAVPLGAFLTPGVWTINIQQPTTASLQITLPALNAPIFVRGAEETGVLAGFKANEQVRAFAFTAINGDWSNRQFVKSFQFAVNDRGFRVLQLPGFRELSILFVGQQGSVYISNATYQGNGGNPLDIPPDVVQKVWAAQPGGGGSGGNTGGSVTTGVERTDGRGVIQVFVKAGCFPMGSDSLPDINNQIRGHSLRTVCITSDFWIDKFEVTNAQWEQFRINSGSSFANAVDFNTSTGADTPRVGMTLAQAQAYAAWRGGLIPTEAQWEYAARGPGAPLYPWGNRFNGEANIAGMYGGTITVGSFPQGASWVGAQDMAGNAGEWISDCYSADYDALYIQDDPVGPCNGSNEMVKGSSFAFNAIPAQSAYRFVNPAGRFWLDVGLRVITPAN
ncbi:MAG: SUMF1/EgtB/PvdO family nonheme iron enzyme [Anaerolineae bacterium]|nr:SUMF1/EgtB/PvdO family nonheme iron enzyme [Anaerolineae bacterium]